MKYLIILGDGMADWPEPSLGDKTLLEYAHTPWMDLLAQQGQNGLLKTVPEGMHPGSEIANMAVMGYRPAEVYEGRGVLEAASMGVDIAPGDMAMRCNLVCIEGDVLKNHSAGHITTQEATQLIEALQSELGSDTVKFHPGVSYRHLLVIKGGRKELNCTPPHDVPLQPYRPLMIQATHPQAEATAHQLNQLILRSMQVLENHPVNQARRAEGKDPANAIWPWSPGYRPHMQPIAHRWPQLKKGAVISAVDLIHGIGHYAGLQSIHVPGATGLYNTNYEGKVKSTIDALREMDFVYLHIEASDEAGHEGDPALKQRTIENLDNRVIGPIFREISGWSEQVTIAILPDHPTPCRLRTHTAEPVPFVIWRRGCQPDSVNRYDERSAQQGVFGLLNEDEFMQKLIL